VSSPVDEPAVQPVHDPFAKAVEPLGTRRSEALDDRYGRTRRRMTPRGWTALLVAVVAVTVALAWWAAAAGVEEVTWKDASYSVKDATSTRIVFDVTMAPGTTAVCTVRALNAGFAEVGLVDVVVGPSAAQTVRVTAQIPTSETAVTGTVKACVARAG
jgi:hypothetical protein